MLVQEFILRILVGGYTESVWFEHIFYQELHTFILALIPSHLLIFQLFSNEISFSLNFFFFFFFSSGSKTSVIQDGRIIFCLYSRLKNGLFPFKITRQMEKALKDPVYLHEQDMSSYVVLQISVSTRTSPNHL